MGQGPLEGGFRVQSAGEQFEVFDQWVEILPTDQIVPVEVAYDPKTGRVTNSVEANDYLKRKYRSGWTLNG